ncbi:MAG TPA: MFS transporter [Stellaceae bacterium]|jgi:sugar phosphate permease|nr:MFS transporter [Stellaceae bacterium]
MAVPRPASAAIIPPLVPRLISARLPVFYGWVVLACLCCAGFARQGPAVATLSIFVEPLTREFGWSRMALSGAASLGGVLAAVAAPLIGPLLDRRGSRLVLCAAVLVNGIVLMLLSLTPSLLVFYLLFCIARMNWAAPFELGLYGALNNWFVRRRGSASAVATLAQSVGLVAMPLIAQLAMLREGWRAGWLAIGATTLLIGFVPSWLFLVRRPEDLGLAPDGAPALPPSVPGTTMAASPALAEPAFSRRQALHTPAFWLLLLYTALVYPVQAGVSLHQAPFLIERGIDPTVAATIVSAFSLLSAAASIACGVLPRSLPIRYPMAAIGAIMALGVVVMLGVNSAARGYIAAGIFGFGIGGILTLLPIAWADYFGRRNFGAIRGIALSAQVLAQASGPLLSGALRDWTGGYERSLECFAGLAACSVVAALLARQPRLAAEAVSAH